MRFALCFAFAAASCCASLRAADRPNVIVIITDDQGYGDLACHGNKQIKTPHMDKLHGESVRLTDYHVDPTCSPTRSALMTGRYSTRTGVWHTIQGRSLMSPSEYTLGNLFKDNGYATAMFGKWHLGDNHPCLPQDFGFQHVFAHGGGGVGQTPDFWGNDYFDDTYFANGKPTKTNGYCTDVWFDQTIDFIGKNKDKPFFCYLSTNAPHGPYLVDKKYSEPYKKMGIRSPRAEFYGMITNIDENLGKLRGKLSEWNLSDNTLLVFTTDNGTAAGARGGGFNAGMRGTKGSEYDGGHRVPCFFHWPNGKLTGGKDVKTLAAHIDMLPTLADLAGAKIPEKVTKRLDGVSLKSDLRGTPSRAADRTLFVHSQRIEHPQKWRKCAVMTKRWRLVGGSQLFDIQKDPGQKKNIADEHPKVVEQLRDRYDGWWDSLKPGFKKYVRIRLGAKGHHEAFLTCHDWHEPVKGVPWHQNMIRRNAMSNGFWAVEVMQPGNYEITLMIRPDGKTPMKATSGNVKVEGKNGGAGAGAGCDVDEGSVSMRVRLAAGPARLRTTLTNDAGKKRGAYFVRVKYLGK